MYYIHVVRWTVNLLDSFSFLEALIHKNIGWIVSSIEHNLSGSQLKKKYVILMLRSLPRTSYLTEHIQNNMATY